MTNLIILLISFGCYLLYNTSKKATLNTNALLESWIQENVSVTKKTSIAILLIGLALLLAIFGIGSGILIWLCILMGSFSLIIIIAPLQFINYKHIALIFLITSLISLFV